MSPERKVKFLNYLQEHLSEKISKKVIETDLQINRDTLNQLIHSLKNYGIKVNESDTHIWLEGYPEIFSLADIVMHTKTVARKIIPFFDVLSTNDIAMRLAIQGEEEGTVVIAERQRQGRGKGRSSWFSPSDSGLWFSIIFRPPVNTISVEKFTLLSAVSVVESVKQLFELDAKIKWPNDVMINGKKFCGILSEGKISMSGLEFIVVGIGINVNLAKDEFPVELNEHATSLEIELNRKVNRVNLFSNLMFNLDNQYELLKDSPLEVYKKWRSYSDIIGKKIELSVSGNSITGIASDFDENGYLILHKDSGVLEKFMTGTIKKVF